MNKKIKNEKKKGKERNELKRNSKNIDCQKIEYILRK